MASHDLLSLADRLGRRQMALSRVRIVVCAVTAWAGIGLIAETVRRAWWESLPVIPLLAVCALAAVAGAVWVWSRLPRQPELLVRLADRQVSGEQQLTTAYELQDREPEHVFLPLLLRRTRSLLGRVDMARLIPLRLGKLSTGSLLFAVLALGVYLLPLQWLKVSRAEVTAGEALVVEEGERLEAFAKALAGVAEERGFQSVERLSDAIDKVARTFQSEPLSPLGASDHLRELSELTAELVAGRRSERPEAFDGEEYDDPEDPTGAPLDDDHNEAGSPFEMARGEEENDTNRDPESDMLPGGTEEGPSDAPRSESDQHAETPETPFSRITGFPEGSDELDMLDGAQVRLQETTANLISQALSEDNQAAEESKNKPLAGTGDAVGDELDSQGQESADQDTPDQSGSGKDGTIANESSGAPSQAENPELRETDAPQEVGFEDTEIVGMKADASAVDSVWMRQLPKLNARELRADGSIPDFQRATVTARSGRALPRAYRSVVKDYHLELERLNTAAR